MDVGGQCLRGRVQPLPCKNIVYLGVGVTRYSRSAIFSTEHQLRYHTMGCTPTHLFSGVGVEMLDRRYPNPSLDTVVDFDWAYAENLPSMVCAHELNAQRGERVLDMCAAPGGKATHVSALTDCTVGVVHNGCTRRVDAHRVH
jgi:hypothetical protein